jgi:NADPH:quinone reductase-like Zn-dependent oxidoreductase
MSDTSMLAARIHEYGGPEKLFVERVPRPEVPANGVLVRVLSAGVNQVDWKIRTGAYQKFMPVPMPWTPGLEGAGYVDAVGSGVTSLKPGDAIYGLFNAAYAEYAAAPAGDVVPKPPHISFEQAAAVPMGALTAWAAVIENAGVQAGQRVLVHGGAGGVGVYAVQLARWKGAHVISTTSTSNADFVRMLGAESVIDYHSTAFDSVLKDLDVVVDTVGGEMLDRSWKVLRPGGILVTVAAQVTQEAAQAFGVRAMSAMRAPTEKLLTIADLIESQTIRAVVGATFPLADVRKAHELSQTGHGRGRIILHIAD